MPNFLAAVKTKIAMKTLGKRGNEKKYQTWDLAYYGG
jgi:hypothetical protein